MLRYKTVCDFGDFCLANLRHLFIARRDPITGEIIGALKKADDSADDSADEKENVKCEISCPKLSEESKLSSAKTRSKHPPGGQSTFTLG